MLRGTMAGHLQVPGSGISFTTTSKAFGVQIKRYRGTSENLEGVSPSCFMCSVTFIQSWSMGISFMSRGSSTGECWTRPLIGWIINLQGISPHGQDSCFQKAGICFVQKILDLADSSYNNVNTARKTSLAGTKAHIQSMADLFLKSKVAVKIDQPVNAVAVVPNLHWVILKSWEGVEWVRFEGSICGGKYQGLQNQPFTLSTQISKDSNLIRKKYFLALKRIVFF